MRNVTGTAPALKRVSDRRRAARAGRQVTDRPSLLKSVWRTQRVGRSPTIRKVPPSGPSSRLIVKPWSSTALGRDDDDAAAEDPRSSSARAWSTAGEGVDEFLQPRCATARRCT